MTFIRSKRILLGTALFVVTAIASCSGDTPGERAGLWVPWPQLEEGECGAPATGELNNVYVIVECDEAHVVEAYASFQLPDSTDYATLDGSACYPEFADRTGTEFADSGLGGTHVYPGSDSWDRGEREIVCLAWTPVEVSKPVAELKFIEDFGDIQPWTQVEAGWCIGANALLDTDPVAVEVVDCEPGSAVVIAQVPVSDLDTCQRIARTVNQSDPILVESNTMQSRGYDKSLCLRWS